VLGRLAAVTLGNVVGGVVIVAVMNHGQVRSQ
jgi:formate/nitrite transporter FocA (FNT family)